MLRRDPVDAVAAHGLLGSRHTFPDEPVSDGEFAELLPRLGGHRLLGLAASAAAVEHLRLTGPQTEKLLAAHTEAMCVCLRLEACLLDLQSSFDAHGIPLRVVKGPASAHLDYAEPTLRSFGDLDLLVPSDAFDTAVHRLAELGFHRETPEPRPGFDRRFGKGATFLAAADGTNVDLHRTFVMGPLGLQVRQDELWAAPETFMLAGRTIKALPSGHRLIAACYNAVVGDRNPRLSTLRDIVQLMLSGEVGTRDAVDLAAGWRASHVLALGIRTAWQRLDIADVVGLSAWAESFEVPPELQRELDLYHDDGAGYAGLSWAVARILPVRDRVAFLTALAFPRGGRLGPSSWGLGQRARRAVRGYSRTPT
jgi:hypothetical protein